MKKILITGANGQLGRSLMITLSGKYQVIGTKIKNEPIANPGMPLIQMDITNRTEVEAGVNLFKPDIIINTAAFTNVDRSEIDQDLAWSVNVGGIENLIHASDSDTKFIHISSDYVFDGENGPYRESDEVNPTSYYGKSKLWGEQKLLDSERKYLILRPNVLYQTTTHDQASFFAWVYTSLLNKKQIKVVTDQTSNPTWVHPFTEVLLRSIDSDLCGLFHYGSADYISRFDFAQLIANIFNLDSSLIAPIITADLNQAAPRPKHSGLISDKIQNKLDVEVLTVEQCLLQIKRLWERVSD